MAGLSGRTTGGYYSYIDSCGNAQQGFSFPDVYVCVDQTYSASTIGVQVNSGSTCSLNCNQGPLSYLYSVTGTCGNVSGGTIFLQVLGGIAPYTIDNITPNTITAQTSNSLFSYTGLSANTYVFRINDSQAPQNNELYFNVNISECFETTINTVSGTTCGDNNGSFYVDATSNSSPYNIILYRNGTYNSLYQTSTLPYLISGLGDGIYNATVYDYGLTTANTENVVISASTNINYGLWKVNTSNCVINTGKLAVTGLTGNGPFTISWSNGQTGQLATGLTQGTYSVTVTDSNGCQLTQTETIGAALPLAIIGTSSTNPSGCFSSDGDITVNISGGTGPYYYSANTSQVGYTLSDTFTLQNMPSGNYSVYIRDANFCSITTNVSIGVPFGFTFVGNTITNSLCNQNGGSITTTIQGANGTVFYSLSGLTNGLYYSQNIQSNTATFNGLSPDNYQLTISGQSSSCNYVDVVTVQSVDKFNVTLGVTGATCGSNNGKVTISVSTGYTNWQTGGVLDYVLSSGQSIIDTPLTSFTFNNLVAGNYTLQVIDEDNCSVSRSFTITQSGDLIATVLPTNCVNGNDGSAIVYIFDGEPTFTYQWSDNTPIGTTGDTATNLSGGSYSVLVTDSTGCTNQLFFDIICNSNLISNYVTYEICSSNFTTTSGTKRGISEMVNEGYLDLTSGYTNCVLNNCNLTCEIEINGSGYTQTFANLTSINGNTYDNLWQQSIEYILSTIPEVGSYTINQLNNTLQIKSICQNGQDSLGEADFKLSLSVDYDISCEGITPTPTPTATPTPTPTPTATPTPVPAFRTTIDTRIVYGPIYDPYAGSTFAASTGANLITLPFSSPGYGSYSNGTINWGDGTTSTLSYANRVHTYTTPGVYQISITVNPGGTFTGIGNNPTAKDRLKFLSIDEWGSLQLYNPAGANGFFGFHNLSLSATIDSPQLYDGTASTDLGVLFENTFTGYTSINNVGSWDVRDVNNLAAFLANNSVWVSGLNTTNYNSLLNGWASYGSSLQNGVNADFGSSKYGPSAVASRNYLISTKGWVITDGGPV